jgi:uncharacterized protein (DUF433 family)
MCSENLLKRIAIDPGICHRKPCVRGLLYPVEFLLEQLSGESTEAEILADYRDFEAQELKAVQAYAAKFIRIKRFDSLPTA